MNLVLKFVLRGIFVFMMFLFNPKEIKSSSNLNDRWWNQNISVSECFAFLNLTGYRAANNVDNENQVTPPTVYGSLHFPQESFFCEFCPDASECCQFKCLIAINFVFPKFHRQYHVLLNILFQLFCSLVRDDFIQRCHCWVLLLDYWLCCAVANSRKRIFDKKEWNFVQILRNVKHTNGKSRSSPCIDESILTCSEKAIFAEYQCC